MTDQSNNATVVLGMLPRGAILIKYEKTYSTRYRREEHTVTYELDGVVKTEGMYFDA